MWLGLNSDALCLIKSSHSGLKKSIFPCNDSQMFVLFWCNFCQWILSHTDAVTLWDQTIYWLYHNKIVYNLLSYLGDAIMITQKKFCLTVLSRYPAFDIRKETLSHYRKYDKWWNYRNSCRLLSARHSARHPQLYITWVHNDI